MAMRGRYRHAWGLAGATMQKASSDPSGACFTLKCLLTSISEPLRQIQCHSRGGKHFGSCNNNRVEVRRWQNANCPIQDYVLQNVSLPFRSRCVRDVGGVYGIDVFEELVIPVRLGFRHFTTKNWAEDPDEDPDDEEQSDSSNEIHSKGSEKVVRWHVDRLCPTSLRVRQFKEWDYDDIIEREKKLKIVIRIKELLVAEPSRSMTLQDLGKCRDYIGLTGGRRIIAFLKKFPAVFKLHETVEEAGKLPWFCLTPEAEAIYEEELEVRKGMKVELLTKLRKLLMMSSNRRLLLVKIAHLAQDLGLPDDFRKSFVYKYPKYFRVVDGEDVTNDEGRLLELVKWSDRLAVTEADRKAQEMLQKNSPGKCLSVRVHALLQHLSFCKTIIKKLIVALYLQNLHQNMKFSCQSDTGSQIKTSMCYTSFMNLNVHRLTRIQVTLIQHLPRLKSVPFLSSRNSCHSPWRSDCSSTISPTFVKSTGSLIRCGNSASQ